MRPQLSIVATAASILIVAADRPAWGGTEAVLFTFGGRKGTLVDGFIADKNGNLFGTAGFGGPERKAGTVFELTRSGKLTTLYQFTGGADGDQPYGGVVADQAGNLYGTTAFGGSYKLGTVFKVAPGGTETVLHSFNPKTEGSQPYDGVVLDEAGNLYGTLRYGGVNGYGAVFKLAPDGTETTLHAFTGGADGLYPDGLIRDKAGNLFGGTSTNGGEVSGTIFKITSTGAKTTLYTFTGGVDGAAGVPTAIDKTGNLYGPAFNGTNPYGNIFKMAPDGTLTVLYQFTGSTDGAYPQCVRRDEKGNLYGTSLVGGPSGYGTLFEITSAGTKQTLYSFVGGADGKYPEGFLLYKNSMYGVTQYGGIKDQGVAYTYHH